MENSSLNAALKFTPQSRLLAPAKLNLFLHILGRRQDGFHSIQTVFQFLDFGDTLEFQVTPHDTAIRLLTPLAGVDDNQNLIIKAARLLQSEYRVSKGVDISLVKRIPQGGGLGGGSSDAATTLVALNEMWELHLSLDELSRLGLKLGSDIPIFIHGKAAFAEGRGELFQHIDLPEPWFIVIKPPCDVATAEIYGAAELTRDTPAITIHDFLQGNCHNDFEIVVRKRYPEVDFALQWLSRFAKAQLTGTGSCIFASFEEKERAEAVLADIPKPNIGFLAKGLNRSPLYAK
jgi:4-diphosphocytidyl-2-C-methyl-D-erythritol kinase